MEGEAQPWNSDEDSNYYYNFFYLVLIIVAVIFPLYLIGVTCRNLSHRSPEGSWERRVLEFMARFLRVEAVAAVVFAIFACFMGLPTRTYD